MYGLHVYLCTDYMYTYVQTTCILMYRLHVYLCTDYMYTYAQTTCILMYSGRVNHIFFHKLIYRIDVSINFDIIISQSPDYIPLLLYFEMLTIHYGPQFRCKKTTSSSSVIE